MGKFEIGNPGGPGGARPGAGRKPKDVAAIQKAIEELEVRIDGQEPRSAALFAFDRLVRLTTLKGASGAQVAACRAVLNRVLGKELVRVEVSGGLNLTAKLDEFAQRQAAATISAMATHGKAKRQKPR